MKNNVFPKMNTIVKMREGTLLSKQQKYEIIYSDSTESSFRALSGTDFFTFSIPQNLGDLKISLESEKLGFLAWSNEILPEFPIYRLFEILDVMHNLKVFSKEYLTEKDFSNLYIKNDYYNKSFFSSLIKHDSICSDSYEESIKSLLLDVVENFKIHHSFIGTDILCDFWGHSELLGIANQIGEERIIEFVKASIDLDIISILFQVRSSNIKLNSAILSKSSTFFLKSDTNWLFKISDLELDVYFQSTPYSEIWEAIKTEEEITRFEIYKSRYLLNLCKGAKLEAFGVFPLFAFIYSKLLDIKNVRMIFNLKNAQIKNTEIEERQVGEYGV